MGLNISNAMSTFDMAETIILDCGSFDLRIKQAAMHNETFKAAVAKRSLAAKKKSAVPDSNTMTGDYEEDVKLFVECIIEGWGKKPLKDDDGKEVKDTPENLVALFTTTGKNGVYLFGKVQIAAVDDALFAVNDADVGN